MMESMHKKNKLCTITIVGRPNVGKSSLFNRILGKRTAVVHRDSGTTRDTIVQKADYDGKGFWLVDTGGFLYATGNPEPCLKIWN